MSQRPYTNQHADMYTCIRIYVNTLTLSFTNVLSNIYRYTRCAFCAYEHTHTLMVHTPAAIVSRRLRESAASARGPFVFGRQSHSWIGELLLFFFRLPLLTQSARRLLIRLAGAINIGFAHEYIISPGGK